MKITFQDDMNHINIYLIFSEGFKQTLHTHSVQQQRAQAAGVEELHTTMETLQQTTVQGNQNLQQTIQDLGVQMKQGKPYP